MENTILECYKKVRNNGKHIRPFIGSDYLDKSPESLRIMALGINSYVGESDWNNVDPKWFYGWAKNGTHRFFSTVHSDINSLANSLMERSKYLSGKHFKICKSLYFTNAVTQYLLESEGKKSENVQEIYFQEGAKRWKQELDILAENNVFPHIIVIFSQQFWDYAWKAFGRSENTSKYRNFSVNKFTSTKGACRHYLNHINVDINGQQQSVLLLRCHHPSAIGRSKVPKWLLEQPAFREIAGIEE